MNKPGRNDPCTCGSGKKFKKCCETKTATKPIGSAQLLVGPNKMSSLFNKAIIPPKSHSHSEILEKVLEV